MVTRVEVTHQCDGCKRTMVNTEGADSKTTNAFDVPPGWHILIVRRSVGEIRMSLCPSCLPAWAT